MLLTVQSISLYNGQTSKEVESSGVRHCIVQEYMCMKFASLNSTASGASAAPNDPLLVTPSASPCSATQRKVGHDGQQILPIALIHVAPIPVK